MLNRFIIVLCLVLIINQTKMSESIVRNDILMAHELQYLSELPLDQLLKVKKHLHEISCLADDTYDKRTFIINNSNNSLTISGNDTTSERKFGLNIWNNQSVEASPLLGHESSSHRMSGKSLESNEKPSKVQSFFQLSITALAFFAFGGYLLCMIVQAIKSKGTTYYHPASMPMTNTAPGIQIKKKRPSFGRRKRNVNETESGAPSPDDMYRALVFAAENYVQFQSIK